MSTRTEVFVWVALGVASLGLLLALVTLLVVGRRGAPAKERALPSRHVDELLVSDSHDDELARMRETLAEAKSELQWARSLAELRSMIDGEVLAEQVVEAAAAMPSVDAVAFSVPGRKSLLATRGLTAEEEGTVLLEPLAAPVVSAMEINYRYVSNELRRLEVGLLLPLRPPGADAIGTLAVFSRSTGHRFGDVITNALAELAAAAAATLENIRKVEELRESALRDPLTGLYNRSFFHQELARQVASATRYDRPLAMLVLDIDDFKRVNERLGHLEADAVLGEVGARISGSIRAADTAGRVGGDEFGIILEGTEADGVRLYDRIKLSVAADQTLTGLRMTVSAGIARHAGDSPDQLFTRAADALRQAKMDGKAQYRIAAGPGPDQQIGAA